MAHQGRKRTVIEPSDFRKAPTQTMILLAQLKNDGSHSWKTLAAELGNGVNASLVRQVCLGICESTKVDRALGLRKRQYRRCAYFGTGKEGKKLMERWDRISEKWGGTTGLARGILSGDITAEVKRDKKGRFSR